MKENANFTWIFKNKSGLFRHFLIEALENQLKQKRHACSFNVKLWRAVFQNHDWIQGG